MHWDLHILINSMWKKIFLLNSKGEIDETPLIRKEIYYTSLGNMAQSELQISSQISLKTFPKWKHHNALCKRELTDQLKPENKIDCWQFMAYKNFW